MVQWLIACGLAAVGAGGYSDEREVAWLADCSTKQFEELASSSVVGNDQSDRWRKFVYALAMVPHGMLEGSNARLYDDVVLDNRVDGKTHSVPKGRQIL